MRRFHVDAQYEALRVELLDRHLPKQGIRPLLRQLASAGSIVELDSLDSPLDRSYRVYVGLEGTPSWSDFNRRMLSHERLETLQEHGFSLTYWILRFSRLIPAWTATWNRFTVVSGAAVPEITDHPKSWEWTRTTKQIREDVLAAGWREFTPGELNAPVRWLKTSLADVLRNRGQDPAPTLLECLFVDLS